MIKFVGDIKQALDSLGFKEDNKIFYKNAKRDSESYLVQVDTRTLTHTGQLRIIVDYKRFRCRTSNVIDKHVLDNANVSIQTTIEHCVLDLIRSINHHALIKDFDLNKHLIDFGFTSKGSNYHKYINRRARVFFVSITTLVNNDIESIKISIKPALGCDIEGYLPIQTLIDGNFEEVLNIEIDNLISRIVLPRKGMWVYEQ